MEALVLFVHLRVFPNWKMRIFPNWKRETAGKEIEDMQKKMLFVYNPRAGKEHIKDHLADILDVFAAEQYEITIVPTRKSGDAREVVAEKAGCYDLVVCSGGDGTLDETVTGMIQGGHRTAIGYIPAGSTNDFGGSLDLPKNMVKAAETIVYGRDFACDIGQFNSDIFVYVAAFGMFTEVSYETDQEMKNMLGHIAYLLEGMKRIPTIQSYHLKIASGEKVIEDDFLLGMVTNAVSVGGMHHLTGKDVLLDDGVFEVLLIRRPKTLLELNSIIVSVLNKDLNSEYLYSFRASELSFESEEPVAWTLDGENGGSHTAVTIRNLSKAVDIRVDYE